jgi:hypothetical protein
MIGVPGQLVAPGEAFWLTATPAGQVIMAGEQNTTPNTMRQNKTLNVRFGFTCNLLFARTIIGAERAARRTRPCSWHGRNLYVEER